MIKGDVTQDDSQQRFLVQFSVDFNIVHYTTIGCVMYTQNPLATVVLHGMVFSKMWMRIAYWEGVAQKINNRYEQLDQNS